MIFDVYKKLISIGRRHLKGKRSGKRNLFEWSEDVSTSDDYAADVESDPDMRNFIVSDDEEDNSAAYDSVEEF